jgi:hypothetical protein
MRKLNSHSIRIGNASPSEEERKLLMIDRRLVAVLSRLSDDYPDPELCGAWFLEAGFGSLAGKHETLPTLQDAEDWVLQHLKPMNH